jgi:hypothetical protein
MIEITNEFLQYQMYAIFGCFVLIGIGLFILDLKIKQILKQLEAKDGNYGCY